MDTKIFIAIIVGVSVVVSALIAGAISFFTRKSKPGNAHNLYKRIVNTLWKIPFMLWYPFQTIIELAHGIFYRINFCIHDFFETETYRKNKEQKLVRKAVSTVLHSHSNLLNTYLNRRVAKVLTFLLQIISFVTTYAGFTFFLGTVNPIAPLFMAITIQGGCYYLLNYTSSRKRTGTWKRNILLGMLILTSTITSYIGIYDGVVRPVEKMERQYENYKEMVDNFVDNLINNKYNTYIDYSLINESLDTIKRIHSDASQAIQKLSQQANNIDTEKKLQASWTDRDGNVHPYVATEKDNEASNQKLDLQAEIGNLQGHVDKLSIYLQSNPDANEILSACEKIIENPDKRNQSNDPDVEMWSSLKDALYESNTLFTKRYPNEQNEAADYYETMKMDKAIKDAENRKKLEGLKLPEFDELISEKDDFNSGKKSDDVNNTQKSKVFFERFFDSTNAFINALNQVVVSKDVMRAQEIRDIINKTIEDNNNELLNELSEDIDDPESVKNAVKEAHIENVQIMPFTQPFTDESVRGEAVFSFITAFSVDFFSLLIAFALVNKQKSILYFKKVGDLRANREEMIEDCLMYICLNGIQKDKKYEKMSRSEIQNFVINKINEVMREFMKKVHPLYLSDNLNSFGYITHAEAESFQEDERRLFFTLNNTALIHPCYRSEIIKIINSDFDEYKAGSKEPQADSKLIEKYEGIFVEGEIFYLVSKNLHVWFCENFAELLQNSLLFGLPDQKPDT